MLLEKVSIYTEILFVHCYKFFFINTCSFSVFVENCILLPKGIKMLITWFPENLPAFLPVSKSLLFSKDWERA